MNCTTLFLKPLIKLNNIELNNNGFLNAYVGVYSQEGENWGNNLYLVFDIKQISIPFREKLMELENYASMDLEGSEIICKFNLDDYAINNIMIPFIHGKYSKICKSYVDANFPKKKLDNVTKKLVTSNNWKVFYKDPSLRKYWEDRIGVEFTEDMEVWSRPEKEDEIYGYPKSDSELAPEAGSVSNTGC